MQKNEVFILELITSMLQTGRPVVVLEKAIESLAKSKDTRFLEKLERVKLYLEAGEQIHNAFFYEGLLSESTYSLLQMVSSKGTLNATFVKKFTDELKNRNRVFKEVINIFIMPLIYALTSSVMGVIITKQFINIIRVAIKTKMPAYLKLNAFVADHPLIGTIVLIVSVLLISGSVIMIMFRKIGYKEYKIFNLASVIITLRLQNIPYDEIFLQLATTERDSKFRAIFTAIAEEVKVLPIAESLQPLYEIMQLSIMLVFRNYLEKGSDVEGWSYLSDEYKAIFSMKMETIKSVAPVVGYLLVAVIIIWSMLPLAGAIEAMLSTLTKAY